ncbi:MAG: hypothetical protein IKV14_00720 [Muribaculaceae bacterium]|nr:hypothetical protein [Muribaculaceae bacterium]
MENNTEEGEDKKVITINLGYIFGLIMIVAYFGFAYLLVFTDVFNNFAPLTRYIFATIFVAYAIFRAYRFIKYRGYRKS